jgi:hypothetical protein
MFFCYLLTDALAGLVVARAPVNKQQKTW